MRRLVILALLFVAMQAVLPLGTPGHGSQWLLSFGFLILAAYSVGELATTIRLPKILGYLAAGALFGPSGIDTVTREMVSALAPVSTLAIALIAYLAGAELRWDEVRTRGVAIVKILGAEMLLSFVAIATLVMLLGDRLVFMRGIAAMPAIAFAMLFATIAVVHSPSVTMALLSESKANGPVARTTLGVVLVSDVVVVLVFSGVLALSRAVIPPTGAEAGAVTLGRVVWEIVGAIGVGALLGGAVAVYLRFVKRELFLFAILVAFFGATLAKLVHVETLLTLLTAGFVTENVSRREDGELLRHAMERSAAPVFVVFFALAGADLALGRILPMWMVVVPIVLVRMAAVWGGTRLGARWAGIPREGRYIWMGLVSQAGVAIGLASVVTEAYPVRGAEIRTIFLAALAVNQMIGPILFRLALVRSGEIRHATELVRERVAAP